jgi:Na+-translocating ferredoxin:NAD+ oxidoreductase RnfG subunit
MIENLKKNIISIIIAVIITPFVAGIYLNTKDVPVVKEQSQEMKTEIKELRKELQQFKDEEWKRYVDVNTRLYTGVK